MKTKGSVLIHRFLTDVDIEEKGFISGDSLAIYEEKLYVDLLTIFSLKQINPYLIPIEKISEEEGGFEIDFEHIVIAFSRTFADPKSQKGWIGPFEFTQEEFRWHKYYGKFSLGKITRLWNESLDLKNDEHSDFLKDIRRSTLMNESLECSLLELNYNINEAKTLKNDMEQDLKDYDLDEDEIEKKQLIIEELIINTKSLQSLYDQRKKLPLNKFEDNELTFLISQIDMKDPDADFELAAKIKKELDLRKSEDVPANSKS